MVDDAEPIHLFEHPAFSDVYDALRHSRLYGFTYRADHATYRAFCDLLRGRVSADTLAADLAAPLERVPDNSALYILRISARGRATLLPSIIAAGIESGFCVFDDRQGRCHTREGVWTKDGLLPNPQAPGS